MIFYNFLLPYLYSATENGAGAFSGTVNASNGGPGYQGGTGASGGTGGNGAPALIAEEFFHNQSEFVTMTGGDGGAGGANGSDGSPGGPGDPGDPGTPGGTYSG